MGDPTLDPVAQTIASNIDRLREIRGFSYVDLARRTGEQFSALVASRICQGQRTVLASEVVLLANVMNVIPEWILYPWPESMEAYDKGWPVETERLSDPSGEHEHQVLRHLRRLVLADPEAMISLAAEPTEAHLMRLVRARFDRDLTALLARLKSEREAIENRWKHLAPRGAKSAAIEATVLADPALREQFIKDLGTLEARYEELWRIEIETHLSSGLYSDPTRWQEVRSVLRRERDFRYFDSVVMAMGEVGSDGRPKHPDWAFKNAPKTYPPSFTDRWP